MALFITVVVVVALVIAAGEMASKLGESVDQN